MIDQIHIAVKAVIETVFKRAMTEEKEKNAVNDHPEDFFFFFFLVRRKNGEIFYRRCTGLS